MAASGYEKFFKDARTAARNGAPPASKKGSGTLSDVFRKPTRHPERYSSTQQTPRPATGPVAAGVKPTRFGLKNSPEDLMRSELSKRIRAKQAVRRKKKLPIFPMACSFVALISAAAGYYQSGFAEHIAGKVLSRVEFGFFGQAGAAESQPDTQADKAKASSQTAQTEENSSGPAAANGEKPAGAAAREKANAVPNVKQWTPEELSFFSKLNDRKKELDLREAELNKLDEELQKRQAELDHKLKQLEAMRGEISKTLQTRVVSDQEKVDKLVQLYANMKPQQAAKIMETENEDLAVEILDKMKKQAAAEILNMMDVKKAQRLSELLTGYQRTPASAKEEADSAAD